MLLGMFLMFLLIVAAEGGITWLIWRRMAEYLRGNEAAVSALTTHLFVPLLGKKRPSEPDKES
jgi:hypothetical protein